MAGEGVAVGGVSLREEVARRLVHASGTVVPAAYVLDLASWSDVQALLLIMAAVALALETLRLFVGLDWAIYDRLTREYEQNNLAGYALYVIGATVTALAFQPRVAVPAILMLTVADPVSGLLGSGELRTVKRPRVIVTTFLLCLALAIPFLPPVPAVAGALAGTAADGAKPVVAGYVIDDNLTIPIAAGAVGHVALVGLAAPA